MTDARRRAAADPSDEASWQRGLHELARDEGEAALAAALLASIEAWTRAGPALRERALALVCDALGGAFARAGWAPVEAPIAAFLHHQTGLTLNLIPGGRFLMGSPEDEPWRDRDEGPQREVTVRPFLCGQTPVTQAAWDALHGVIPWRDDPNPQLPVSGPSWDHAQAWLSRATGELRLLSEAEWEYACRAGSARQSFVPEGANIDDYVRHRGNTERLPQVATRAPNAFGLYDTLGLVWEWVEDSWIYGYAGAPADARPRIDPEAPKRVRRGACWTSVAEDQRAALRMMGVPRDPGASLGLRVARSLTLR